jgi:hypothetical protein
MAINESATLIAIAELNIYELGWTLKTLFSEKLAGSFSSRLYRLFWRGNKKLNQH